MRKYELMFIINPETTEEQRSAVIAKVQDMVVVAGATELKIDLMGEKKLAYEVAKKKTGVYVLFTFMSNGTELVEVENRLNITEEVIKYMIVKIEE